MALQKISLTLYATLYILSFGGSNCCLGQVGGDHKAEFWRCSRNGGVNVLYCFLRAKGFQCDHKELLREQQTQLHGDEEANCNTLVKIASKYGARLTPVSLTRDELASCELPLIVHMDGKSLESGSYLLLIGRTKGNLLYMNGPSASIHQGSYEDFYRVWSGIALMPQAEWPRRVAAFIWGALAGGIVVFLYPIGRSAKEMFSTKRPL